MKAETKTFSTLDSGLRDGTDLRSNTTTRLRAFSTLDSGLRDGTGVCRAGRSNTLTFSTLDSGLRDETRNAGTLIEKLEAFSTSTRACVMKRFCGRPHRKSYAFQYPRLGPA